VATKKNEQGSLETHKAHELKGSATKEKKRTGTRTAQLPSEKTRIKNTIIAQLSKKLFKKQVDKNSNKNVLIAKNGNKSGSMTKGKKTPRTGIRVTIVVGRQFLPDETCLR